MLVKLNVSVQTGKIYFLAILTTDLLEYILITGNSSISTIIASIQRSINKITYRTEAGRVKVFMSDSKENVRETYGWDTTTYNMKDGYIDIFSK
jgi:hypothetical protein